MADPILSANPALESQLARAVDEFMAEHRRGGRPAVEDFVARHPELAEVLRQVLPALAVLGSSESGDPNHAGPDIGELGDFHLIREVGRGGMGIVYEAE